MRFAVFGALLAFLAFAFADDVIELTDDNFEATVSTSVVFVKFYAPWCGHCKNLAPKWSEAATLLKGIASIAKIDCTVHTDACGQHGISGYPTLKLFKDGKASDYKGARETADIVSFMKKQVSPPVAVLEDAAIEEFSNSDRVAIIGFFEALEGEKYDAFFAIAKKGKDNTVFGASTSAAAATAAGAALSNVVMYKAFDEPKLIFAEDLAGLAEWIQANSVPTMDDIGPENYQGYVETGLPLVYLFVGDVEDRKTAGPGVEQVAKEMKGKMNFVYIDAAQFGGHASNLNLVVGEWPALSVEGGQIKPGKYPFKGDFTYEAVKAHCEGILAGTVEASIKSEEAPETQGNVLIVTGHTFNEIVMQKKDVLVEFYATWCGHCKKLAPIYEELGDSLAANNDIIIAKMNVPENDLPSDSSIVIEGFPTIMLVDANNKVIEFEGDRTLDGFVSFLKESAVAKDTMAGEAAPAATHVADEL